METKTGSVFLVLSPITRRRRACMSLSTLGKVQYSGVIVPSTVSYARLCADFPLMAGVGWSPVGQAPA